MVWRHDDLRVHDVRAGELDGTVQKLTRFLRDGIAVLGQLLLPVGEEGVDIGFGRDREQPDAGADGTVGDDLGIVGEGQHIGDPVRQVLVGMDDDRGRKHDRGGEDQIADRRAPEGLDDRMASRGQRGAGRVQGQGAHRVLLVFLEVSVKRGHAPTPRKFARRKLFDRRFRAARQTPYVQRFTGRPWSRRFLSSRCLRWCHRPRRCHRCLRFQRRLPVRATADGCVPGTLIQVRPRLPRGLCRA